jgi:hypothetical protein
MEAMGARITPAHAGNTDHGLSADLLKQLPSAIADPVAIFKSATESDSLVVMTELKDNNGSTVIVPFHLNVQHGRKRIIVNFLVSAYGKDKTLSGLGHATLQLRAGTFAKSSTRNIPNNQWFVNQITDGNLMYLDTQKSSSWLTASGLQLPKGITIEKLANSVPTETDLVNMPSRVTNNLVEIGIVSSKIKSGRNDMPVPPFIYSAQPRASRCLATP